MPKPLRPPRPARSRPSTRDLLAAIERHGSLRLRVLPDILSGASAGGINAVFLAQAIHSGRSLEPLTELWLQAADVERLVDPEAKPWSRMTKAWASPISWWMLRRPGNAVSESVAPETREEVRRKVDHLVRSRWFAPPFSGEGFSALLAEALDTIAASPAEAPLLPPNHPLDLFVTATDFHGYLELLRLNSPPIVEESEHRMPIAFSRPVPVDGGAPYVALPELVLAARATASFPGAFPPLQLDEIDRLLERRGEDWPGREDFLRRVMSVHVARGTTGEVSLIDGSVLVNRPFAGAIDALAGRPAQREVDRRFVYIDPRPDRIGSMKERAGRPVGFFAAIFGSLSTIPREQPIRDNLEVLEQQSQRARRLGRIVRALRPQVEEAVERLFGRTLMLDRPTPRRLAIWRNRAQTAAANEAGFAYQSYAQGKLAGIVELIATGAIAAAPELMEHDRSAVTGALYGELERRGLSDLAGERGGASEAAISFLRAHDIRFRIRRLRLIARRLSRDWDADETIADDALEAARGQVYAMLSLYFPRERTVDPAFAKPAARVLADPGSWLDALGEARDLKALDEEAERLLAEALFAAPKPLRRRMLLTYLGFPFYDIATLPLLQNDRLTEFDQVKVDRISPDDARSIREGGTRATLRGIEFYNFGAFFSRAYRENDYLWGRLHGAERMIDLVSSTLDDPLPEDTIRAFKRRAFLAVLRRGARTMRHRSAPGPRHPRRGRGADGLILPGSGLQAGIDEAHELVGRDEPALPAVERRERPGGDRLLQAAPRVVERPHRLDHQAQLLAIGGKPRPIRNRAVAGDHHRALVHQRQRHVDRGERVEHVAARGDVDERKAAGVEVEVAHVNDVVLAPAHDAVAVGVAAAGEQHVDRVAVAMEGDALPVGYDRQRGGRRGRDRVAEDVAAFGQPRADVVMREDQRAGPAEILVSASVVAMPVRVDEIAHLARAHAFERCHDFVG